MKQIFKLTLIALTILFTSCDSSAQQKDTYSAKIDSLLTATQPRSFNGVVFIQQDGKQSMQKHMDILTLTKKRRSKLTTDFLPCR